MRELLWVLLAVDVLQLMVALAAVANGLIRARRARVGQEDERQAHASLARYSFSHAALLALGAAALAIPVVLGLTGVIDETVAVAVAVALELLALPFARGTLAGLERAHRGRVESSGA